MKRRLRGGDNGRSGAFEKDDFGVSSTEVLSERVRVVEEVKGAIVVGKGLVGVFGKTRAHAGGDGGGSGGWWSSGVKSNWVHSVSGGRRRRGCGKGQSEKISRGEGADIHEGGMNGGEISGGGADEDVMETLLFLFGLRFTRGDIDGSRDSQATIVEEVNGGMLDGWVPRAKEGTAHGVGNELAFVVDGGKIMGNDGRKGVENGAGRRSGGMRLQRGSSGTESNFLVDWIVREGRERGEVQSERIGAGTKGNRVERRRRRSCRGRSGCVSRRWRHRRIEREKERDGREQKRDIVGTKGSKDHNNYRSHATKDGARRNCELSLMTADRIVVMRYRR